MSTHLLLGKHAEDNALRYLKQQGLSLLGKNYRCYFGEIDLIMQEQETLVFVEVRLRQTTRFGSAAESITPQKIQRLIKTARHYLHKKPQHHATCKRFDVITFDQERQIRWIKNAFDVQYY